MLHRLQSTSHPGTGALEQTHAPGHSVPALRRRAPAQGSRIVRSWLDTRSTLLGFLDVRVASNRHEQVAQLQTIKVYQEL
jgi:hypothetical protein